MKAKKLSPKMRAAFFATAAKNAAALGYEQDEYRYRVMLEEAKVRHFKDLTPGGWEKCMARMKSDLGDWEGASRYALKSEKRYAHLCEERANEICRLKGIPEGTDEGARYIAGILRQSRMYQSKASFDYDWWQDLTEEKLRTLFFILDTHSRRLKKELDLRELAAGAMQTQKPETEKLNAGRRMKP